MAWAFVRSAGNFASGSATTNTQAFGANVAAGNLIWVSAQWSGTGITATVTDSLGNTYANAAGPQNFGASARLQLFYAKNIAGGACTVTITYSSATTNRYLCVHEASGLDTVAPLDGAGGTATGTSTAPAASVTTSQANDMLVGGTLVTNTASASSGTIRQTTNGDATQDQNVASAGAATSTFSQAPSGVWSCAAAAFKEAAGGGGGATVKQLAAMGVG